MTPQRYSKTAMLLHWLIAAALAFQIGLGEAMEHLPRGPQQFDVAQFHKAVGITILVLTLWRIAVRFSTPRPAPMGDAGWAQRLAGITHWGLYAFMLLAPLSGWIATSTSRFKLPIDMFGVFHWPAFPMMAGLEEAARKSLHEFAEDVHGGLVKIAMLLFLLHIAGALRHQFLMRQPTVERMMPGSKPLSPVLGTAHILGFTALLFGILVWGKSGPAPAADPAIAQSLAEQRARLEAKTPAPPVPATQTK